MYKVRVSATSANLGCGFDVLGLALGLFNEYTFQRADEFILKGFAPKYLELNKNLVYSSYVEAFRFAGVEPVKAEICEVKRDIPRAGGLGSSASCAVAGIIGANRIMGNKLSKSEILQLATRIDGHPDNVSAAIYGGLTATMKTSSGYVAEKYGISEKLRFLICYPDFYVSTEMARGVLPENYSRSQTVENLSRIVNLPRAFADGNVKMIGECVKDNIHEPYRIKLIDEGELIRDCAERSGAVAVISGSGATMLVIGDENSRFENFGKLKTERKWTFTKVKPYVEVKE